jgi:hypothetical protein
MMVRVRVLVAGLLLASSMSFAAGARPSTVDAACANVNLSAAQLNNVFSKPNVGGTAAAKGYAGGDYQRVYPLPDGRKLWLFQDMFFSADNDLRDSLGAAAHNAGLVQTGACWRLVGGPGMKNFIGSAQTVPLKKWYWAMDGQMGADGALWIFMVEMQNPSGTGATWGARPTGTWVARVRPATLQVLSFTKARDAGTRLYGWSIVSDSTYSYLYSHCYRQYINKVNSVAQFDATCMPNTYLARVPKGQFGAAMQYWTGSGWSASGAAAVPVLSRGHANPMDVSKFGNTYVNVTKVDEWWGADVVVDRASAPQGPWTTVQRVNILSFRRCSQCGVYHAHVLPYRDVNNRMVVAVSDGSPFALWQRNAFLYRPQFLTFPIPT